MITDQRRREIQSYLVSPAKATEYLDMIENTIRIVHRDTNGTAIAVRLLKLRGIMQTMYHMLHADGFTTGNWLPVVHRLGDMLMQFDAPPPEVHAHQVVAPGAELFLDTEAEHTYRLDGDPSSDTELKATLLGPDGKPLAAGSEK